MAHIVEITNPFEPLRDNRVHVVPAGGTVLSWLQQRFPGFQEFDRPTICIRNGVPVLRRDWATQEILEDDVVNFVACPGTPIQIHTRQARSGRCLKMPWNQEPMHPAPHCHDPHHRFQRQRTV